MSDLERRIRDLRRRGREAAEEARREEEEERRRSRARAAEAEDRMRRLRNSPRHRTQRQIGLLTEEVGGVFYIQKLRLLNFVCRGNLLPEKGEREI